MLKNFIDQYISLHPSTTLNTAYQVDPLSDISKIGEVLIDTKTNELYNVRLTITDINYGFIGLYNFYRIQIIKHKSYDDERLLMIDSEQAVKAQEQKLDDILELELSCKILLAAQVNLNRISPLDYLYKSINCQFEAMNKDDIDSQLILRYIWTSASNIQIEQIFKIARPNDDERLFQRNFENHYLLWHRTNICNLISVGQDDDDERCFMLLCKVALDNSQEVDYNDEKLNEPLDLTIYQSLIANDRQIPDPQHTITRNYGVRLPLDQLINCKDSKHGYHGCAYNEYIVFDESQITLHYLVQFRR
ncbi:unnamed protein product [Rotaria sp. Silwood1]|nr:unnamed protein product [Rotaria sp. Silwood1]